MPVTFYVIAASCAFSVGGALMKAPDIYPGLSQGAVDIQLFGQSFLDNYTHMELIGPEGHFMSDEIAAGLVIYGPGLDYPDHWHMAEEIYIPLTHDGLWSADGAPLTARKAGTFIFHESNMRHAIRAGRAPLVALWVWRNGDLRQKADY